MAMAADPEGRKKLIEEGVKVPPVSVARDFRHLSKKVKASDHLKRA